MGLNNTTTLCGTKVIERSALRDVLGKCKCGICYKGKCNLVVQLAVSSCNFSLAYGNKLRFGLVNMYK